MKPETEQLLHQCQTALLQQSNEQLNTLFVSCFERMVGDERRSRTDALPQASEARQQLAEAIASKNYDLASIDAGQAVGLITWQQSAGDVIQHLGKGAKRLLREGRGS